MKLSKRIISVVAGLLLSTSGCVSAGKTVPDRVRPRAPRLQPLMESQWTEEQTKILNNSRIGGKLLNLSLTLARHPKMMERWNAFAGYVLKESTLPRRDREILILRVGRLAWSDYEFGQHTIVARWIGMPADDIERIIQGADAPGLSSFDAALIRAADELIIDQCLTDVTWQALSAVYNEKQMMDLILTVGQYSLVSMLLNSLGVQREPGVPGFPGQKPEKE